MTAHPNARLSRAGRRSLPLIAVAMALAVPATTLAISGAWTRQFGTPTEDIAGGIAADGTGITVVGTTGGSIPGTPGTFGGSDAVIRRYDRAGTSLWTRQFGTASQ